MGTVAGGLIVTPVAAALPIIVLGALGGAAVAWLSRLGYHYAQVPKWRLERRVSELEQELSATQRERDAAVARLGRLEDTRPNITVRPWGATDRDLSLEVENSGGPAEFSAQIEVLEESNKIKKGFVYEACWYSGHVRRKIGRSQKARLRLATLQPGKPASSFQLYHCVEGRQRLISLESEPYERGRRKPECRIRLTISADPPLVEPWSREYVIGVEGIT